MRTSKPSNFEKNSAVILACLWMCFIANTQITGGVVSGVTGRQPVLSTLTKAISSLILPLPSSNSTAQHSTAHPSGNMCFYVYLCVLF